MLGCFCCRILIVDFRLHSLRFKINFHSFIGTKIKFIAKFRLWKYDK